jgi:predicted NUDIX family NTP pyrophosphohydrolase
MSSTAPTSAGLVLCRRAADRVEVLLVHPGGPFWAKKDEGAWSIPKGIIEPGEDALAAARRETAEELGIAMPEPPFVSLGDVRMKSGKRVVAWAARSDFDASTIRSNEIDIEWPPRSGRTLRIPEVDRAAWVTLDAARTLANPAIVPLLERATSAEILLELLPTDP